MGVREAPRPGGGAQQLLPAGSVPIFCGAGASADAAAAAAAPRGGTSFDISSAMMQVLNRRLESLSRGGAGAACGAGRGDVARSEQSTQATLRRLAETAVETWSAQLEKMKDLPIIKHFENKKLHEALPPAAVGLCVGIVYSSFSWVYMPVHGVALLSTKSLVFHGSLFMTAASYHQGVVTPPGDIPDCWAGRPDGQPNFVLENPTVEFRPVERKKTTGSFRYCKKMMKFKPDRSHFCRQCNKGILRMDHHCPWLANCVGHYNQKPFFLTLFYATAAACSSALCLVPTAVHSFAVPTLASAGHTFMLVQGAVVSSMLAVILAPFLGLHCWLIANNLTTLEFFENRSKRRGAAISPYSIDIVHNLKAVLGDDPLKWLLPIGKPPGDGTWYAQASWAQGEAGAEDAAGAASSAAGAAATASASAPAAGGAPAAAGAPAAGGEPGDGLETGAPSSAAGSSAAAAAAPGLPGGGLAWCAGLLPPARAAFETTVKATKATVARAAPPVTELCADAKELVSVCWRAFRKEDDDEVEADTLQTLVRRRPRPPSAD